MKVTLILLVLNSLNFVMHLSFMDRLRLVSMHHYTKRNDDLKWEYFNTETTFYPKKEKRKKTCLNYFLKSNMK